PTAQSTTPAAATSPTTAAATSATPTQPASCTLTGTGLYFIDSLATTEAFSNPTHVPEGYVGATIEVPPPTGAVYYLRLRDDPATIDTVALPSGPLDKPAAP